MRLGYTGTIILLGSAAVLFGLLLFLFWFNRAEPKVWEYMLPAFALGLVVPLAGMLTALQSEENSEKFPITLFFYKDDFRMVPLDQISESSDIPPPIPQMRHFNVANTSLLFSKLGYIPSRFHPITEENFEKINSEFFYPKVAILGTIYSLYDLFPTTWNVEISEYRSPGSRGIETRPKSEESQGDVVEWSKIKSKLENLDLFEEGEIPENPPGSISQGIKLPPGTDFEISSRSRVFVFLKFINPKFEFEIKIRPKTSMDGFGELGSLISPPVRPNSVTFQSFIFEFEERYKWWAVGNPWKNDFENWFENIKYNFREYNYEQVIKDFRDWRSYR